MTGRVASAAAALPGGPVVDEDDVAGADADAADEVSGVPEDDSPPAEQETATSRNSVAQAAIASARRR